MYVSCVYDIVNQISKPYIRFVMDSSKQMKVVAFRNVAKTLASLHTYTGLPASLFLDTARSTKINCAGLLYLCFASLVII